MGPTVYMHFILSLSEGFCIFCYFMYPTTTKKWKRVFLFSSICKREFRGHRQSNKLSMMFYDSIGRDSTVKSRLVFSISKTFLQDVCQKAHISFLNMLLVQKEKVLISRRKYITKTKEVVSMC